jgi:hypothetical protein
VAIVLVWSETAWMASQPVRRARPAPPGSVSPTVNVLYASKNLIFNKDSNNKLYAFMDIEVIINYINGISLVIEPNTGLTLQMNDVCVTVIQCYSHTSPDSQCLYTLQHKSLQTQHMAHRHAFLCRFLHHFCIK